MLKKLARWGLAARMIFGALLTCGDMVCDILVAILYLNTPSQNEWAYWSFGSIALSLVAQMLAALTCHQSTSTDLLSSLFGAKQMLETWRVISGAPTPDGQVFSNETMLAVSRVLEVVPVKILQNIFRTALHSYGRILILA